MQFFSCEGDKATGANRIVQQLVDEVARELTIGRKDNHADCVVTAFFFEAASIYLLAIVGIVIIWALDCFFMRS